MPRDYQNKIEKKICPYCGDERPLDWFGRKVLKINVYNAKTHAKVETVRYRKFKACWKCRAFHPTLRKKTDPLAAIPLRYRLNPNYTFELQRDRSAD